MCDTFVALPGATATGGVVLAKNSDREPNEAHEVVHVPAAQHGPGEEVRCTYLPIPQAPRTHAVLLGKPYWIWGAEMGANEHGVVIGNEAVFTRVPHEDEPGLIGMDLLRLGLERGDTAVGAVDVITALLERYGQAGDCGHEHPMRYHNGFLVADRQEAWVLETAGLRSLEKVDRLLAALGFVDDPALVFEGELHRRTDAFIILDGKNSCTHTTMMPHFTSSRRTCDRVCVQTSARTSP